MKFPEKTFRTVGLGVLLALFALAITHHWFHGVFSSLDKIGALAGFVVALIIVAWATISPGKKVIIPLLVVGAGCTWLFEHDFSPKTLWVLGIAIAAFGFWMWIIGYDLLESHFGSS